MTGGGVGSGTLLAILERYEQRCRCHIIERMEELVKGLFVSAVQEKTLRGQKSSTLKTLHRLFSSSVVLRIEVTSIERLDLLRQFSLVQRQASCRRPLSDRIGQSALNFISRNTTQPLDYFGRQRFGARLFLANGNRSVTRGAGAVFVGWREGGGGLKHMPKQWSVFAGPS